LAGSDLFNVFEGGGRSGVGWGGRGGMGQSKAACSSDLDDLCLKTYTAGLILASNNTTNYQLPQPVSGTNLRTEYLWIWIHTYIWVWCIHIVCKFRRSFRAITQI